MDNINMRIKELRKLNSLVQDNFAEKVGINRALLAKIETEKSTPTYETIVNIVNVFHISADWLLTGRGKMFLPQKESLHVPAVENNSAHIYKELYLEERKKTEELLKEIGSLQYELRQLKNEVLAYERACLQKPVAEPELELKE